MPAYNGEKYQSAAIQSVLAQTYENWELIIVDDGSTDNTASLVSGFALSDSRIRYFYQENAGQANARNTGIRNSRGHLIAFLDQDDLWVRQKLELQVRAMEESGADVVFSNGFLFVEDDIYSEAQKFPIVHGKYCGPEMFRLLFIGNRIPVLSALVKRKALESIGLLDEDPIYKNSDDYDLWLRLATGDAVFVGLPDMLVRYRLHQTQASKDTAKMIAAELSVLKKHEQTRLLNAQEKHQRIAGMYDQLILDLVDQKRFGEARTYVCELRTRKNFFPAAFGRALLLTVAPNHYRPIFEFACRVQGGLSRRVARYVTRAPNAC